MSFDEILDLTADVLFYFIITTTAVTTRGAIFRDPGLRCGKEPSRHQLQTWQKHHHYHQQKTTTTTSISNKEHERTHKNTFHGASSSRGRFYPPPWPSGQKPHMLTSAFFFSSLSPALIFLFFAQRHHSALPLLVDLYRFCSKHKTFFLSSRRVQTLLTLLRTKRDSWLLFSRHLDACHVRQNRGMCGKLGVPYVTMYITHPSGGFQSSIALQLRGCQYRTIRRFR